MDWPCFPKAGWILSPDSAVCVPRRAIRLGLAGGTLRRGRVFVGRASEKQRWKISGALPERRHMDTSRASRRLF